MSKPDKQSGQAEALKCQVKECKTGPSRFGFCKEHFDHYKFGLVNKEGRKVSDYERKFEHFTEMKKRSAKAA